ncbi:unnamed protein product [Rhizophagus irregularis]|nr:unnamed protein product [Rhizophagus irregularis]
MIDVYLRKTIVVCELSYMTLKHFRILFRVSQNHNIAHTELAPKNIMYFQKEKDGCTENWKLIDFDSACIVDRDNVKINELSAPEITRARDN